MNKKMRSTPSDKKPVGAFMRSGEWRVLLGDGTDRATLHIGEVNEMPLIGAAAGRVAPLLAAGVEWRHQRDEYLEAVGILRRRLTRGRRGRQARALTA